MDGHAARLAAICDPYRPSGRIPSLPHGYLCYAAADDPCAAVVTRNPPLDVCPTHVSRYVVAIYCEAVDHTFLFVSVYAPPHSPLESILDELARVVSASHSPNVIVAGDFNAKHRLQGAGGER
ncbi:hypothetical protein MTO96_042142 [Rhipicephalus appendiculatus]